jgi:hypothetical protein
MEEMPPQMSFLQRKIVPLTFWILEKKNAIFYSFFSLVVAILLLSRYLPMLQKEEHLLSSEDIYKSWLENREDIASWKKLQGELENNNFLKSKYGSDIAQRWMAQEDIAKASPLVQSSLQKLGDDLDYYAEFSQTSWKITEGKIEQALEDARAIKKKMDGDASFSKGSLLYGHNLLRILFLEKSLSNYQAADLARVELEGYLQKNQTKLLCEQEEVDFFKSFRKNKHVGLADFLADQKNLSGGN